MDNAVSGTRNGLGNVIDGNDAANKLYGGAGNDTLTGGLGDDTLAGGTGNDWFRYDHGFGHDMITDLQIGT